MTDLQHGFNTSLQDVDDKFAWINDMIKSRQELLVLYMKVLSTSVLEGDKSTYNRKLNYNSLFFSFSNLNFVHIIDINSSYNI